MLVTFALMVMLVNALPCWNAPAPMLVTLAGMLIEFNCDADKNAKLGILVNWLPGANVTVVRAAES